MYQKLLSTILLLAFSFNSFAKPVAEANKLKDIMIKYDYLLTSHQNSHDKDFRSSTLENYKKDIKDALASASKEELDESFQGLIAEIPTEEKRKVYLKVLNNASDAQRAAFLTDPTLLADALRGESANFFSNVSGVDILLIALGALVVTILVVAIVNAVKYQYYYGSFYMRADYCSYNSLTRYNAPSVIEENKATALNRCLARANRPDTCRFDGWSYEEIETVLGFVDCDIRARYISDRK